MDKEQAINLAKRYKEMVAEKLPLKALYLYGSYSKGNYRADSDIDIAVIVERLDDDYFKDTPLLWKLRRKISNLIEPVLLTEDMDNHILIIHENPVCILVALNLFALTALFAQDFFHVIRHGLHLVGVASMGNDEVISQDRYGLDINDFNILPLFIAQGLICQFNHFL